MPKWLDSSTEELAQTESTTLLVLRPGFSQPRVNLLSERQAVIQSTCQLVYLSVAATSGGSRMGKVFPSPPKMEPKNILLHMS